MKISNNTSEIEYFSKLNQYVSKDAHLAEQALKVEMYGATRMQEGHTVNEDAFIIGRGSTPYAALCDGAGNAEQSARRILRLFETFFKETDSGELLLFQTWMRWIHLLDSALLEGAQSTFIAVAVLEGRFVGTCVGDSRAYLRDRNGTLHILTEKASKHRLGSGSVEPFPIHVPAHKGDIMLLMSDGAWTPLNQYRLQKIISRTTFEHPSDLPGNILDEASRAGRADDMTVVAIRVHHDATAYHMEGL
jgi:serine/threonine protein phosphatase PrpC